MIRNLREKKLIVVKWKSENRVRNKKMIKKRNILISNEIIQAVSTLFSHAIKRYFFIIIFVVVDVETLTKIDDD